MATRSPTIGVATLRAWSAALPPRATVLDLACGSGVPITELLVARGLDVFAIDASPTLAAAFRARFPAVPIACESAEDSAFFHRRFDAVVAWGLVFLLAPEVQERVLHRVASTLRPHGHFLFTAPAQACQWADTLTGQRSESLGARAYRDLLATAGFTLEGEADDEGGNHYFLCRRNATAGSA